MPQFSQESLIEALPSLAVIAVIALGLWLINWLLLVRRSGGRTELPYGRQIAMLVLTGLAIVAVILVLPVGEQTRNQLLTILGLALTLVVTVSSTTFVANVMAGFMLRAVRSFRTGDFLRVESKFGRVTERGLFHTEIQTEDRDLTTIPNLFLVSRPFTVVRKSGTIVSATVSLGYDVPHTEVERLLVQAGRDAGLTDPFVHVRDLGDYSITYRVAGFLTDVKRLLSHRSMLREKMLDTLHDAGVEIVSPTFMNQRRIDEAPVISESQPRRRPRPKQAEPMVFDKAERASMLETLRGQATLLEKERDDCKDGEQKERLEARLVDLKERIQLIEDQLAAEDES